MLTGSYHPYCYCTTYYTTATMMLTGPYRAMMLTGLDRTVRDCLPDYGYRPR